MGFCPPYFEPQDQNKIYYTLSQTRLAAPASAFQRRTLELLSKRPFEEIKLYMCNKGKISFFKAIPRPNCAPFQTAMAKIHTKFQNKWAHRPNHLRHTDLHIP